MTQDLGVVEVAPGLHELGEPTAIAGVARKGGRYGMSGSWSSPKLTVMPLTVAEAYCWEHLEVPEREAPASYDYQTMQYRWTGAGVARERA